MDQQTSPPEADKPAGGGQAFRRTARREAGVLEGGGGVGGRRGRALRVAPPLLRQQRDARGRPSVVLMLAARLVLRLPRLRSGQASRGGGPPGGDAPRGVTAPMAVGSGAAAGSANQRARVRRGWRCERMGQRAAMLVARRTGLPQGWLMAGAHVPLEFVRPEGARYPRCFGVLRHGVRVQLRPAKLARLLAEVHAEGQAIRARVTECAASSWGRTRIEVHLEVGTHWAAESPSCGPGAPSASTADMGKPPTDPGLLALQRLAEREALWAAQEQSSERRAIRRALNDVQALVRKWLGWKATGPGQPVLLEEWRAAPESLLGSIREELRAVGERARGSVPGSPGLRGRQRGLREGLDIVAEAFGELP
jgi:hypothetical protein